MGTITYQEILSQPYTWKYVINESDRIERKVNAIRKDCAFDNFYFVGCGTSYFLSLTSAWILQKFFQKRASGLTASDVYFFPELFNNSEDPNSAVFIISRSGTTTEGIWVAETLKQKEHFTTFAISCRPESELVKRADHSFVIQDADEKSVVMTRSFTSMLLLIKYISGFYSSNKQLIQELSRLPTLGEALIDNYNDLIKKFISSIKISRFIFLGQGPFYGLASESMLKIKEMSLSISEVYQTLEYRHGPMSMVGPDVLIIFLLSERSISEEKKLLLEMRNLGANILVICDKADKEIKENSDFVVELKSGVSEYVRLILYMPITQLLGFYQAKKKGLDPDNPKNLSQVVQID
ncbi:MAG: SIS domain-containing protein [bacterium]